MKNIYILKQGKEFSAFYYGENKSIYIQKINENRIYENKIIENCLSSFSVSLDKEGKIYILSQDFNENIILAKAQNSNGTFNLFNILKKDENISNLTFFTPLFFEKNISLIFNSNINGTQKNNFLSVKTFLDEKQWSETENIDIFSIGNNNIYEIQKLNEKDVVLAYEKKETELQLGFKEIIDGKISPFTQIHKTGLQIVDFSFLATGDEIHFIYIIKTLFSSQVIYKRKDKYGVSSPVILYEGQKLRDCSLALINNELYCMFIGASNLLYSTSKDLGNSFSNVSAYRKPVNQDIVKAKFLEYGQKKSTILNEVYVDYKNPMNIYFIPEIYPEYACLNIKDDRNFNENRNNKNTTFISDLSKQNITFNQPEPTKNLEIQNISQANANITIENKNILPNLNRAYETTSSESDFMSHFNPQLFEDMLKNKNINNIAENLNTNNIPVSQNLLNENDENFIKNKLKIANEQIKEKDIQIIKLNNSIQEKQKEKLEIELDLRKKLKKLEEENKTLKENMEKESDFKDVAENKENIPKEEDK